MQGLGPGAMGANGAWRPSVEASRGRQGGMGTVPPGLCGLGIMPTCQDK